jgi:GNAT superfamily N-acetyltransferase
MSSTRESSKIEVRTAEPGDAGCACNVLRRSIAQLCEKDHRNDTAILTTWLANKTPETVRGWIESGKNCSLVAVIDNQVAGIAILTRQGKIVLFYVAPEMCQAGAGNALLQAIEHRAGEWGLRTLQVDSTLTAQQFYLRHGFTLNRTTISAFGTEAYSLSKSLVQAGYPQKKPCRCGG